MALVTLAEYVAFANLPAAPANQTQIEAAIDRASNEINRLTQRAFDADTESPYEALSPEDVIEIFDGNDAFRYFTRQAPIVAVSELEYWDGTQWYSVDDANMAYTLDTTNGEIWFDERHKFHKGQENWRVTYTYDPTVPDDLKTACLEITQFYIEQGKHGQLSSQADGEQSFGYKIQIPDNAFSICQRYRRY